MFDDVIKLCCRRSDLLRTPEFWQAASFEQRMSEIREAVKTATGYYPTKNMQPIREGVFKIRDDIEVPELVALGRKLKERHRIDCFQVAIDRQENEAHMLFDCNDRETGKSVNFNHTDQIFLSVTILNFLDLKGPKGTEQWPHYFVAGAYDENPMVFEKFRNRLKHAKLSKQDYQFGQYLVSLGEMECLGLPR
jgi:hypothetical protein